MLKRVVTAVSLLFVTFAAFAQHDHHLMTDDDYRALAASMSKHGPMIPQPAANVVPTATVNVTITATSFAFNPSTITVNQGDTVNITLQVPAGDSASSHGILMSEYIENGRNVNRGQSTSISFVATTSGTFGFVCNVPSCGSGHSNMFGELIVNPVTQPAPTISTVLPNSGAPAGGTNVTITGTNFANGATVTFGGNNATNVNVVSATSITCTTPAHAAGQVAVTVKNPDNQAATLANGFTYANTGVTVTGVSPSTGPTSGDTPVTITGTNFAPGATVTFGNVPAFNVKFVDANTITALTPFGPANEQVSQAVAVKVTNPDSTSGSASLFTYSVPALAVLNVEPPSGPVTGGNVISIIGAGFTTAVTSSVKVGGVTATNVQVIDAVTMKATVPAHAAGSVDVAVTVGSTTVTKTNAYVYGAPPSKRRGVAH